MQQSWMSIHERFNLLEKKKKNRRASKHEQRACIEANSYIIMFNLIFKVLVVNTYIVNTKHIS